LANLLDRFKRAGVGSAGRIADFLPKVAPYGDFTRTTDLNTILASWNNILLTPTRTYTHDPEYGTNLIRYIFEPATTETLNKIKREVEYKLTTYDDRATITNIEVFFLQNKKGFVINIYVDYEGERAELSASIDEETYFNFLRASQ